MQSLDLDAELDPDRHQSKKLDSNTHSNQYGSKALVLDK